MSWARRTRKKKKKRWKLTSLLQAIIVLSFLYRPYLLKGGDLDQRTGSLFEKPGVCCGLWYRLEEQRKRRRRRRRRLQTEISEPRCFFFFWLVGCLQPLLLWFLYQVIASIHAGGLDILKATSVLACLMEEQLMHSPFPSSLSDRILSECFSFLNSYITWPKPDSICIVLLL